MEADAIRLEYGTFFESAEAVEASPTHTYVPMYAWIPSRNRVLGVFLIIVLLSIFGFLTWMNGVRSYPSRTAVVIDAGSSHTHFTLFSWKNVESVMGSGQCIVDRGISTLLPEEVNGHLETCLANISKMKGIMPKETRLFLGATAGMRHLSPEVRNSLLEAIRDSLDNSGFDFRSSKDASVLSGEREGLYDWLTINYLSGNSSIGVMDMGGASCQISYECDRRFNETQKSTCTRNALPIHFKNQNKYIFTQSEPCYGINSAHKRYLLDLIYKSFVNKGSLNKVIHDPCISRSLVLNATYLQDNQCSIVPDPNFQDALLRQSSFRFIPSSASCRLDSLFETCIFKDCFSPESYPLLPEGIHHFMGEASLFWEFYEILNENTHSNAAIESSISKKCLKEKEENKTTIEEWGPSSCFKVNYIYKLLRDGYSFRQNDELQFLDVYNKIEANWSLGLLIALHPDFRDVFWEK